MNPIFNIWSEVIPRLPLRTESYSLEPIGIETGMVEGVTGYVMRLAEEHSFTVGDLVGGVLANMPNVKGGITSLIADKPSIYSNGFVSCDYAIDGVSDRAMTWVQALETATGQARLELLSLLPFRRVLAHNLFNQYRTWCPLCLDQWRTGGQTIYEPLLWGIKRASYCLVHKLPLRSSCPQCQRTLRPLACYSSPGHCSICGSWLGMKGIDMDSSPQSVSDREDKIWCTEQVFGLLEMLPLLNQFKARESFAENLASYLEEIDHGSMLGFSQYLGTSYSILDGWINGDVTLRLDSILRISRVLAVPTASFFAGPIPTTSNMAAAKQAASEADHSVRGPLRSAGEIRLALQAALDQPLALSLSEVARQLGYKINNRLRNASPSLCDQITKRYLRSGRSHWWKKPGAARVCEADRMKEALEHSLRLNESTSVRTIGKRLGFSGGGALYRMFPDLCEAISSKILAAKITRREEVQIELSAALQEDPPPSLVELTHRLNYSSPSLLRRHQPKICELLEETHLTYMQKKNADLEKEATTMLLETPVPSLRTVCRRLDTTVWMMKKYHSAFVVRHENVGARNRSALVSADSEGVCSQPRLEFGSRGHQCGRSSGLGPGVTSRSVEAFRQGLHTEP